MTILDGSCLLEGFVSVYSESLLLYHILQDRVLCIHTCVCVCVCARMAFSKEYNVCVREREIVKMEEHKWKVT